MYAVKYRRESTVFGR